MNRIQINGIWYVPESEVTELPDIAMDYSESLQYEDSQLLFRAERLYDDDGKPFPDIYIEYTDKVNKKTDTWDNPYWMRNVLLDDDDAIEHAREVLDNNGIRYLKAFLTKLRDEHKWL
jgi:hypothetical protein